MSEANKQDKTRRVPASGAAGVRCLICNWRGKEEELIVYMENKAENLPGGFIRHFPDINEFCPNCGSVILSDT